MCFKNTIQSSKIEKPAELLARALEVFAGGIVRLFYSLDGKLFAVGAVKCAGVIGFIVKRKDVRLSFFRVG